MPFSLQHPNYHDIDDNGSFELNLASLQYPIQTFINPLDNPEDFGYVFQYQVEGTRQTPHKGSDSFQLHAIQDFEFDERQKSFSYWAKYVVVAMLHVRFRNGSLIITACSSCSSYQNLQMFLPIDSCCDLERPTFSPDRFYSCRHAASVISEVCDHFKIPSKRIDILQRHNFLNEMLNTSGNVTAGWQSLGTNLLTLRKHVFGCYLTSEYHLLSFNLSRKNDKLFLLCNSCNRRNCSHCQVANQNEYQGIVPESTSPEFTSTKERHTLYSTLPYSIDTGGFDGDFSPGRTDRIHQIIRSRALSGSSYFRNMFLNNIISQLTHSFTCCQNMNIVVHKTTSILVFTQTELITDFSLHVYRCEECKKSFHFEGHEVGLLNYSNNYVFCVELFYKLLDLKYRSGLSTNAWWNSKIEMYLRLMEEKDRLFWRNKLENISGLINLFFTLFLKLLEYPKSVMKCCGGSPDVITLDGIVMSIESKRIREANLSQPWISGFTSLLTSGTNFNRQSTRKSRNILDLKKDEKILFDLYTSQEGVPVEDLNKFSNEYRRNPVVVLMKKSATIENGRYKCEYSLKSFFRSCRKDITPAISFLPKCLWTAVDGYLNNDLPIFDLVFVGI